MVRVIVPTVRDVEWPLAWRRVTARTLLLALLSGLVLSAAATAGKPLPASAVRGYVLLCGGPAPGRCSVETIEACAPPNGCIKSDRVLVIDSRGRRVAQQKLVHARFYIRLRPGRYTGELLGDGDKVRGVVTQTRSFSVRAHRTTVVRFLIPIP
jgi:hypothetical protein